MALPRGLADKKIIDAINANTEAVEALDGVDDALDTNVTALVEDTDSALYAALVALIAAATAL